MLSVDWADGYSQRENIPQPEEESRLIKSRVNCNNCNVYCKDIMVFIMQCRKSKRGANNPLSWRNTLWFLFFTSWTSDLSDKEILKVCIGKNTVISILTNPKTTPFKHKKKDNQTLTTSQ